jgi:hypothetical protein
VGKGMRWKRGEMKIVPLDVFPAITLYSSHMSPESPEPTQGRCAKSLQGGQKPSYTQEH